MVSERVRCLVDIARSIRNDPRVPRASRSLVLAIPTASSRLLRGRDFVAPQDIEQLAVPFHHRIATIPGAESAEVLSERPWLAHSIP